jgi:hypothetical protein
MKGTDWADEGETSPMPGIGLVSARCYWKLMEARIASISARSAAEVPE